MSGKKPHQLLTGSTELHEDDDECVPMLGAYVVLCCKDKKGKQERQRGVLTKVCAERWDRRRKGYKSGYPFPDFSGSGYVVAIQALSYGVEAGSG